MGSLDKRKIEVMNLNEYISGRVFGHFCFKSLGLQVDNLTTIVRVCGEHFLKELNELELK